MLYITAIADNDYRRCEIPVIFSQSGHPPFPQSSAASDNKSSSLASDICPEYGTAYINFPGE